ncbi:glyoxalase [Sphingomonas gei]|uniref:Glyoxalase n=1 Tax=Sphingomonas gei TaxID=1395960 RepID=A0A4S1WXZ5_9SPHN|nr:VOC family protein [Sphingomonas gei]TGX48414.1 glyoxalase [Sphingomonas gei]
MGDQLDKGEIACVRDIVDQVIELDHIAVAVPDLEAAVSWYHSALGFELIERRTTTGVSTSMISAVLRAGRAIVVLVQGIEPDSQVSRFIEEFGPGVQHVAFAVEDIDVALASVSLSGGHADTSILSDVGIRQVFLRRDARTGVRIELIERNGGEFTDASVQRLFRSMEANEIY